ncbi:MAG TPA: hypothetical protein VM901_08695 [Bdellovibrionota bacterium]|jgi:hypothetical protein|nr:hypothetical protein [Bdellovibrionota bacterium]
MKTAKTFKIGLIFVLTAGLFSSAFASKSRLEERLTRLFYWQMSQALDLSTAEEKRMSEIMDSLSKRRLETIDRRDQVLAKMGAWLAQNGDKVKGKDLAVPPATSALLKEYRTHLETLAHIDVEEQTLLKELLGEFRLIKFYNERKIIVERIKKALN